MPWLCGTFVWDLLCCPPPRHPNRVCDLDDHLHCVWGLLLLSSILQQQEEGGEERGEEEEGKISRGAAYRYHAEITSRHFWFALRWLVEGVVECAQRKHMLISYKGTKRTLIASALVCRCKCFKLFKKQRGTIPRIAKRVYKERESTNAPLPAPATAPAARRFVILRWKSAISRSRIFSQVFPTRHWKWALLGRPLWPPCSWRWPCQSLLRHVLRSEHWLHKPRRQPWRTRGSLLKWRPQNFWIFFTPSPPPSSSFHATYQYC